MSPVLLAVVYALTTCTILMTLTAWGIWVERKLVARMQTRLGPTMVGPVGLFQPVADLLKLLQKQDLTPAGADRVLYKLAPPLAVAGALAVAAVVPFAPPGTAAQLDVGVPYALAVGGLLVYPVWIAGWASNDKFALLGAMRAVAQMVAYEVPLVLAALVPVVLSGSMSLTDIAAQQAGGAWLLWKPVGPGLVAFVLFMVGLLAESNRAPFDIPEAESELVAGVTTEYSGMSFGMMYLAEYLHTLVGSGVAAALFLGGNDGPGGAAVHWMVVKTLLLFGSVYWVRWTLLRLRSDQLMSFCWKWLVPASVLALAWAAVVAGMEGG